MIFKDTAKIYSSAIARTICLGFLIFSGFTSLFGQSVKLVLTNELKQPVFEKLSIQALDGFGFPLKCKLYKDSSFYWCKAGIRRIQIFDSTETYFSLDTLFKDIQMAGEIKLMLQLKKVDWLDDVVITADKTGSKLKESTVSLTMVKPYLVDNKITGTISEILGQIPGVTYTDQQVNIRNGSGWSYGAGSRVMVLVDGLPILSGDAGAAQWAMIPFESMQHLEVVKTPGSVLYGSGALNGVINLLTLDPIQDQGSKFTAFTGQYSKPKNKNWWPFSRNHFYNGASGYTSLIGMKGGVLVGFNALQDEGYRLHEFNNRFRLTANWKNNLSDKVQIGLNSAIMRGNSGTFLLWESFDLPLTTLDSGYSYTKATRFYLDPSVQWKSNKMTHQAKARFLKTINDIETQDTASKQSNSGTLGYFEYRFSSNILRNIQVQGGLSVSVSGTKSPLFSGLQHAKNIAPYLQFRKKWKRLSLDAGFRYEYFLLNQTVYSKPVTRAGLNYTFKKFTFLRASAGQGLRFPSMAEAFISTAVGPVNVYPNPQLKPETGYNLEIGAKQGFKIRKLKGYFDLAAFHIHLENMMEFSFAQWSNNIFPPTFGLGFMSVNTGKTNVNGAELEFGAEGKVGKWKLQSIGGYTYTNAVSKTPDLIYAIDSSGNSVSFYSTRSGATLFAKYRTKHQFKLDLQASITKWDFGFSVKYFSKILNIDKAFQDFIIESFVPGIKNSLTNYPQTIIFDIRTAYQICEKVKINFQVQNLFNAVSIARPADIRSPRLCQIQVQCRIP